jgi:hypothetical protein
LTVKIKWGGQLAISAVVFVIYSLVAARPIPKETVLVKNWINSLETGYPGEAGDNLIPFKLTNRFGYFDPNGVFSINRETAPGAAVSMAGDRFAEYEAIPTAISVNDPRGEAMFTIENPDGYPLFLAGRSFIVHKEQAAISEIDKSGEPLWRYDFSTTITCMDATDGILAVGLLNGAVELLDNLGKMVYSFEPGGSRIPVILGCALSTDSQRIAILSGIDKLRFLLLEKFGNSYRVIFHEFLNDDFRRPCYVGFINEGRYAAYELENALGFFDIGARRSMHFSLSGKLTAIHESVKNDLLFLVCEGEGGYKELSAVQLPGSIALRAPFKSNAAFLGAFGTQVFVIGDKSIAAFDIETR